MRQIKKLMKRGMYDPDKENPFDLFISSTSIRYTYYKESQNILGSTFGMLVLQDFEALTPNLLCRTVETVEGGGLVVLLLKTMKSLRQLYTMTMDTHARYRTEAHADVTPRFNERFILSLGGCKRCLFLDDELNVLPLSRHSKRIEALELATLDPETSEQRALAELQRSFEGDACLGPLVALARTHDQARAILQFAEAAAEDAALDGRPHGGARARKVGGAGHRDGGRDRPGVQQRVHHEPERRTSRRSSSSSSRAWTRWAGRTTPTTRCCSRRTRS